MKVNARKTITIAKEVDLDIIEATLLTITEVRKLPERLKIYDDWWLKTPGSYSCYVAFVNYNGVVDYDISCCDFMVRPALVISNLDAFNLQIGDTFVFGRSEFEIITNSKALCSTWIEISPFREDWKADDANDYEKSDIKKIVDEWFEKSKKELNNEKEEVSS